MNLGKCIRCSKSVYEIEAVTAGPPGKTKIYHKGCFKCFTCGWQLTLTTYRFWEDQPYCKNHYPVTGFGDQNAKHVHGSENVDSVRLETALNAPKLDKVNEQIRGPAAGQKPNVGSEAIGIANAMNAPKLDTVNQNVVYKKT